MPGLCKTLRLIFNKLYQNLYLQISVVLFKIVGSFEGGIQLSNCLCSKCFWNSFYGIAFSTIPLLQMFLELFYYYNNIIFIVRINISFPRSHTLSCNILVHLLNLLYFLVLFRRGIQILQANTTLTMEILVRRASFIESVLQFCVNCF